MTPDAAKMLLKYHRQLSGGLNPYNLPKGFYTQRDAAGTLVLGYKSTLQYTTDNNPLTLRFLEKIPEPEVCPGDFRQFNLSKYTDGNIAWDDEDYAQLKLFSQLQPRPKDVEDQLKEFMLTHQSGLNNATKTLISGSKAAILDNWSLFYTLWTLKGEPGLREFFTLHKKKTHRLSAAEATALLLQKVTEPPKNWAVDVFSDIDPALYPKISVALGQVYFRYGAYGLTRLLTPLYRMQHFLGTVFFDDFLEGYLFQCDTFSPLMSESALQTFDKMTKLLSESPQAKALWTVFLKRHMGAVDWEDFTQLWKGFEYFYLTIQERELHDILTPSILDQVKPDKQNMLVLFDRILLCLEKIPNVQQQEAFLAALSDLDLTEGGVPYAIRHEGFVIADKSLQLQEFYKGKPTYAPNLKELNSWAGAEGTLFMHRALALQSGIKPIDYQYIIQNIIVDCSPQSKRKLLWVLHSQFGAVAELDILGTWNVDFFQDMAAHFHKVFYIDKIPTARFPLSLFKAIEPDFAGNKLQWRALLAKYANVMLLECINILHGQQALDAPAFDRLRALFDAAPASHPHLQQGLMLATVFGVGPAELQAFYAATLSLKGIVRQELSILSTQLLSLDIKTSADKLTPEIWSDIIQGIQEMNEHPAETAHYRMELFKALKTKGLIFKTSVSGDYRSVKDSDIQELSADFGFFEQHQERLKTFFKNHIVISEEKGARPSLMPIMDFFKRLQLNKTYINEVEPLLATLESILKDHPNIYWTAEYFNRLLRALQSTEESTAFPIAILEAVLKEKNSPFWPKGIDEIDLDFPKKLGEEFTFILSKAESFTREQQSMLARLALRANAVGQDTSLIRKITERLMLADFQPLRAQVLESLLQGNIDEIELNFARCTALLELAPGQPLAAHWTDTCQLWIETITRLPELNASLLEKAKELYADPEKLALVLHIVAWSSFPSDMLITAPRRNYIEKGKGDRSKTAKLVDRLQTLSMKDLRDLATKYPAKPAPDTKHLLDFIKVQTKESFQSSAAITPLVDAFLLNPYSVAAKRDYQQLAITRERDFQRMLEDTRITRGEENDHLSVEDSLRLTMMFKLLKQLESGQTRLPGVDTSISDMTQEELSEAFASLSQQAQLDPDNDVLCTQIWAVLFAVLGRTSGKYPHLAQQFSLIANEIALKNDPSSILQLKTGEGKSHFVAMRAARHVGLGKNVDVCTAKWSLAERDLIDYKPFFDYLNIRTANVKATSARSAYEQAQIVYTTPGDFSLFLDAQAFSGNPIKIDKNMRVGLGDEFDFLFYEGQKTQYNYAQHTGITPKEMVWFYRALNQFYDEKLYSEIEVDQAAGKQFNISADHLARCFDFLTSRVGTEEGLLLLDDFRKNPIELVGWLQSAHEAAKLKMGVQYTVRLERVKIGEEEYPLQEIYPLTKDMQAAVGSTFSHGVHQLVADRLNQVAKTQGLSQNYHVHPESNIVSSQVFSQRLRTLWGHWEGFTGTVSAAQAAQLHGGYGTAVLRVPTNQKDLRKWPDPTFCETPKERLEAMARTIKHALKEKKSILWCCKTDKEVTEMVDAIKPFFTKEEFDTYFMSYTNESQDSPADVLRQKKAKEGLVLGQKERGVVLIAAGFGRGDNVDVEMVLLGSVHDENDLGQKGGRTARNGEEGEVQQFYLRKEVDEAFFALLSLLPTHYPERRDEIITALMEKEADIGDQGFFDDKGQPTAAGVAALSSKFKFDTVLRLDEFLQSLENQASLAYHEAKAQLSSVAIAEIGSDKLDPSERKDKARSFANHLAELENQWIKIQADKASPKDRINALHHYLQGTLLKSLKHLFKLDKDFPFTREDPPGLTFLLEPQKKPRTEAERWLTEIQSHLLQIDDWPTDPALWKQVVTMLGGIAADYPHKLKDIYRLLQQEQSLTYNDFIGWVARVREQTLKPEYTNLVEEMKNVRTRKDKDIVQFLSEKDLALRVHACMIKLAPEVQQDALLYLQEVGLSSPEAHAVRTLPLLQYVSSMKPKQALQAASYFSHTMAMDTLLDLPPACFNLSTAMHADYLILVKKFLDRMLPKSTSAERYAASFQGIVNGCKHQTEKRLRWLATWEMMLSSSENKEALLETLTALMTQFEAPGHFMVFQTLLDKVSKAYIEPLSLDQRVVESTRLDAYWHSLLKQCPTILKALPVLEMALNQSGKEFFFCLETLSKVQAELIVDFQVPITSLWASSPGKTKKEKMEKYAGMLTLLQRWYKALPADKLGQYTIHHMQKLPSALFAQAINNWEKHEALFMETPLLFAYYVEYLNKETPSAEDSRVLQLLLKLGHAKLPAGHLEAYLFQLSKYREEPQQLSVFLDLVSWNDSSERKPEFEWQRVSELWLNTERVNKLTKLPAAVYGCLQPMMKSYGALFAQHPAALDALIAYMESAHFEAEHVERLCQVLKGAAKACRNDSKKMQDYATVLSVQFSDKAHMDCMFDLIDKYPEFMTEIASNGLVDHLKTVVGTEWDALSHEMIKDFYDARAKTMFSGLRKHFGEHSMFEDMGDSTDSQKRVACLHLLNKGAFLPKTSLPEAWSEKDNDTLLSDGLDHYTKYAAESLAPHKKHSHGAQKVRGLKKSQQVDLFRITKELKAIGTPSLHKAQALSDTLKKDIQKELKGYQKTWFKNTARKKQIVDIQEKLNDFLDNTKGQTASDNMYRDLLTEIMATKADIMKQDMDAVSSGSKMNMILRLFRPLHKKGHSRLYRTLNKIQDQVLKAWATDTKEVQSLQDYTFAAQQEMTQYADAFYKALEAWIVPVETLKENGMEKTANFLFFYRGRSRDEAVKELIGLIQEAEEKGDKDAISNTLHDNKELVSSLPGELRTLAKEVLARSKALRVDKGANPNG
ncbi:MAG: hypothetical protein Q8R79_06500 [Legionellaceae bacterium]|nr:hypothetical protein [Legionellaceae bacterium]